MALQHHLGVTSHWIPELHAAVLGTAHHPLPIGGQAHAEHEVLVTDISKGWRVEGKEMSEIDSYLVALKGANAFAALDAAVGVHAPRDSELPQLDRLVQTATDQVATVGGKRNRVHAVLVAVWVLQSLHKVAGCRVPHTDALVQRSGRNVVAIGRHSHRGDAILDAKGVDELAIENVPQTHGLVPTARGNVTAVAREVQGVDVLLVAGEDVLDRT